MATPDPCAVLPACPICDRGPLRLVTRAQRLHICVCLHCETTLSVPDAAMEQYMTRPPLDRTDSGD